MMLCIDTTLAVSGTYTKQNERYIEQKYVYLQRLTGEMVRDIESVFCFILRSKSGQFWYLEG